MKYVKEKLYFLKVWYRWLFTYPVDVLDVHASLDYDEYWKAKRPGGLHALSRWEQKRADIVVKAIEKNGSVSIADIGCGPGVILHHVAQRLDISRAVGYDTSARALEHAASLGIETIQVDLSDRGVGKKLQPVDYFLLLEFLEHIPHSEQLLADVYEKARKGVFFSFPNTGFIFYRLRLLFGRFPLQWVHFPNEHLRFWTARDLKWWLRALGYTHYTIFYYRGLPVLGKLWPSLFSGSFVVFLDKKLSSR